MFWVQINSIIGQLQKPSEYIWNIVSQVATIVSIVTVCYRSTTPSTLPCVLEVGQRSGCRVVTGLC